MKVLIAGGSGFLGTALINSLRHDNHKVIALTRRPPQNSDQTHWDGKTMDGWGYLVNEVDAVVHLTGFGLEHWPWTPTQKQKFIDSRVIPGLALASAIQNASRPPKVFLQSSGINRYGLRGEGIADESTPPGEASSRKLPSHGSLSLNRSKRWVCAASSLVTQWCLQNVADFSRSWLCQRAYSLEADSEAENRLCHGST